MYYKYSQYLKDKYNQKVYKLLINLPLTCPNRDGCISFGGCSYCGSEGAGFESLSDTLSVKEQLFKNMSYIRTHYKANKFIAYFQNYTNTYMPIEDFKTYIKDAIVDDIVNISISTRPDCINDKYLEFLYKISIKYNVTITIELGLQTANYNTLLKVNRGHGLAEFIDAVLRIKKYNFDICTHIILNLPWDCMSDIIETSKILSALEVTHVKLHALYIVKNTKMAEQYLNNEFEITSLEEYKQRVITFLEYLSPKISIQRLIGRAPEKSTLFVNWNRSWRKIHNDIENQMLQNNNYQGRLFNYLNGKCMYKNKG